MALQPYQRTMARWARNMARRHPKQDSKRRWIARWRQGKPVPLMYGRWVLVSRFPEDTYGVDYLRQLIWRVRLR